MLIPTVHLNGTSKQSLLDQQIEAMRAIRTALDKLLIAAPHGRDYYPQGDTVIFEATTEHVNRIRKLQSVYDELETIALGIDNQGK